MKILFLHGWHSVPGGVKPTFLRDAGHEVINPPLDDGDFAAAVRTAQAEYDRHRPGVIVGSSRGGAVAMNINSGTTPLVLLCPAWKRWGTVTTLKPNSVILHSLSDEVVPFEDSVELITRSGRPSQCLIEVGTDHRLAEPEPLQRMLQACEESARCVEVTVFYLEMREFPSQAVPPPRSGLEMVRVPSPTVQCYRSLYDAVGRDYHWRSRRVMSDETLRELLDDPGVEVHVLQASGSAAGFAELDFREPADVELVQFGLLPEFIGQGLGTWFLRQVIERVRVHGPRRLWLHTCTLDHPAARTLYRKAGFVEFRTELIRREL